MKGSKVGNEQDSILQYQTMMYFDQNVKPIYSQLISSLVHNKPEDVLEYCMKWFKDRKRIQDQNKNQSSSDDDDKEEDSNFQTVSDQLFRQWKYEKMNKARKNRYGISSQKAFRGPIKVDKGQKKQGDSGMRILCFCMNSFLFRNFSEKQIGEIIQKMKKEEIESDEQIFKQGQYGDKMYFVDEGIFQCIQETEEGTRSIKLFYVGDTFGEICLLHMVKRQASIISRNKGVLYSLDRQSYIHFKKMSIIKKRTLYLCTLMKLDMFSSFSEEKLEKICDVMMEVSFEEGEMVINEGDVGSKFFIILDGILVAFKGNDNQIVCCYKEGDAFGELALISDQKTRLASVKALTHCRMVYITRQTFKRIFEDVDLQKQVAEKYSNNNILINKRRFESDEIIKIQKQGKKRNIGRVDKTSFSID